MGRFADAAGFTPLIAVDLFDEHHQRKLRALSITSVDEMSRWWKRRPMQH